MSIRLENETVENVKSIQSLQEIAERGKIIYRKKYKDEFQEKYNGKFVVINIVTGDVTVSDASHDAIRNALDKDQHGYLYLMRVGPAF